MFCFWNDSGCFLYTMHSCVATYAWDMQHGQAMRHGYFCLQNDVYLYALQRVIPRTFALLYTKGNWIGHLGQPMQNSVISQETKSS